MAIFNWMEKFTNRVTDILFHYRNDEKREENDKIAGDYILTSIFPNKEIKKEVEKYL